jgi:hypothetical protein
MFCQTAKEKALQNNKTTKLQNFSQHNRNSKTVREPFSQAI